MHCLMNFNEFTLCLNNKNEIQENILINTGTIKNSDWTNLYVMRLLIHQNRRAPPSFDIEGVKRETLIFQENRSFQISWSRCGTIYKYIYNLGGSSVKPRKPEVLCHS